MTLNIDARSLKKFSTGLRKASPSLYAGMRSGVRAGGQLVANQAKQNAAWSTRIPGSIKVGFAAGKVTITAGGKKAPDAAPLENKGNEGQIRHPVFGNTNVWVAQPARPFLHPALAQKKDEATALVGEAVSKTLDEVAKIVSLGAGAD